MPRAPALDGRLRSRSSRLRLSRAKRPSWPFCRTPVTEFGFILTSRNKKAATLWVPAFLIGSGGGNRTPDQTVNSRLLYR